jgi:4-hydroxy-2,2'-bipyrrole-5-carbaldehyde O-methyltransferase
VQPRRILDVGCGTGVYLRHAALLREDLVGVGLDLNPRVAEQARRNLAAWGAADGFEIRSGDVREAMSQLEGTFDLILLFQMLDYFTDEDRLKLLRDAKARLASGGALVIVAETKGDNVISRHLDVLEASTEGEKGLPELEAVLADMGQLGFSSVKAKRILPGGTLIGFLARQE